MQKSYFFVEGDREVFTYVYLWETANFALENAKNNEDGRFYNCLASILFSAFCFEAYLNHVGYEKISDWDKIEHSSKIKKLKVICKTFNIPCDFSKSPFQTIRNLFSFRDYVVHGRTEQISIKEDNNIQELESSKEIREPKTILEEECSIKNAEKYLSDIKKIITEIHKKSGLGNSPFIFQSIGSYTKRKFNS